MSLRYSNAVFLFLLVAVESVHGIDSVADLHQTQLPAGFSGQAAVILEGAKGNVDKYDASIGLNLFRHSDSQTQALLISGSRSEVSDTVTNEKFFSHARMFVPRTTESDAEFFVQLSQDEFSRLKYRGIVGSGLRWRWRDQKNATQNFTGLGVMYEKEEISAKNIFSQEIEESVRANLYALYRQTLATKSLFGLDIYLQPKMDRVTDVRVQQQSHLTLKITNHIDAALSITISHDSEPPQQVEHTDIIYHSGLKLNF